MGLQEFMNVESEAKMMANLCSYIALGHEIGRAALKGKYHEQIFSSVQQYTQDNARAWVIGMKVSSIETIVVVWAGTDGIEDWLHNLDFRKMQFAPDGRKVHRGFMRYYGQLAEPTLKGITELMKRTPARRLIITGHSLGAAAAAIQACRYSENQAALPVAVYMFGSPRVGNRKFSKEFLPDAFRFSVLCDPVTSLPPIWYMWHVGKLFLLRGNGLEPMEGWIKAAITAKNIFDSLFSGRILKHLSEKLKVHKIENYIQELSR